MFSKVLHIIKGSSADTNKSTMYVLISRIIIKIKE